MKKRRQFQHSPYWVEGRFINEKEDPSRQGFKAVYSFLIKEKKGKWPRWIENANEIKRQDQRGVTFINHASFLVKLEEIHLLTDPLFSMRAGPFALFGPKRKRFPGIGFDLLPRIDVVLISHNHYDHLDLPSLKKLEALFSPLFIVPLGDKGWLMKRGLKRVVELDWWESIRLSSQTTIHFVPAQHWSGRWIFDRNKSFWGGFVVEEGDFRLFHAGDTGYGSHFKEIGRRFPIDVALLPLGAYKPQWFLKFVHMNPEEALQAHLDLKAKQSFGMHHDCLNLSSLDYLEVEKDFQEALERSPIGESTFSLLDNGEFYSSGRIMGK